VAAGEAEAGERFGLVGATSPVPGRTSSLESAVPICRGPLRLLYGSGEAHEPMSWPETGEIGGCLWERSLGETAEPSHLAAPPWAHLAPGQALGKARVRSPRTK
jgi:hypothetical protein